MRVNCYGVELVYGRLHWCNVIQCECLWQLCMHQCAFLSGVFVLEFMMASGTMM